MMSEIYKYRTRSVEYGVGVAANSSDDLLVARCKAITTVCARLSPLHLLHFPAKESSRHLFTSTIGEQTYPSPAACRR